jgi:calcyclin binding protein
LITKLRKEAGALKRVEASKAQAEAEAKSEEEEEEVVVEDMDTVDDDTETAPPPRPVAVATPPVPSALAQYVPVDKFLLDVGGYGSKFVTLHVELPGVGSIDRSNITCDFVPASFDLIVKDLNGKNFRLVRGNLEHDIDTETSKIIVKANKVVVKLGKQKQEYGGHEHWSDLTAKKKKSVGADGQSKKDDPQSSIMGMMKDLYDSGDDQMKKMIGETMEKQQRGELGGNTPGMGMDQDMGV